MHEPVIPNILLIRPQADAEADAAQLRQSGRQVVVAPVLEIRAVPYEPPQQAVQAVLLTSRHAVPALQQLTLPAQATIYAVGEGTRKALQNGMTAAGQVVEGGGDAESLLSLVCHACRPDAGALLYLRGREVAKDLAAELFALGYQVEECIVYAAEAAQTLPLAISQLPEAVVIVPLLSARSASVLAELLHQAGRQAALAQWEAVCISPAVADTARQHGFHRVFTADEPNREAILRLVEARMKSYTAG